MWTALILPSNAPTCTAVRSEMKSEHPLCVVDHQVALDLVADVGALREVFNGRPAVRYGVRPVAGDEQAFGSYFCGLFDHGVVGKHGHEALPSEKVAWL